MITMKTLIASGLVVAGLWLGGCQRSDAGARAEHTPGTAAPRSPGAQEAQPVSHDRSSGEQTQSDAATVVQRATFGAGCFWGVEELFRTTPGVVSTRVGYAGGHVEKPTYKQVCTDQTGHAEVVEVTFDPAKIGYDTLVDMFFRLHDPTQLNRQGPDYGSQYRSVIFYHSPEQKATAEATLKRYDRSGRFKRPIVTRIEAAPTFWPAEEYHQQYFHKNGIPNHCHVVD